MKKFLFVLIAFFALGLSSTFARTVETLSQNEERTLIRIVSGDHEWVQVIASECADASYEVVHVTKAAIILQVTRNGNRFWQTVAMVARNVLPTTTYALCMATIGKPRLCAAIYELSKALIEVREGIVRKGTTYNIPWVADKPTQATSCSGLVETQSFADASDAATVYEEYASKGCMPYKSTQIYAG